MLKTRLYKESERKLIQECMNEWLEIFQPNKPPSQYLKNVDVAYEDYHCQSYGSSGDKYFPKYMTKNKLKKRSKRLVKKITYKTISDVNRFNSFKHYYDFVHEKYDVYWLITFKGKTTKVNFSMSSKRKEYMHVEIIK